MYSLPWDAVRKCSAITLQHAIAVVKYMDVVVQSVLVVHGRVHRPLPVQVRTYSSSGAACTVTTTGERAAVTVTMGWDVWFGCVCCACGDPPPSTAEAAATAAAFEEDVVVAVVVLQEPCKSRGGSFPWWISFTPCCRRLMWPTCSQGKTPVK